MNRKTDRQPRPKYKPQRLFHEYYVSSSRRSHRSLLSDRICSVLCREEYRMRNFVYSRRHRKRKQWESVHSLEAARTFLAIREANAYYRMHIHFSTAAKIGRQINGELIDYRLHFGV